MFTHIGTFSMLQLDISHLRVGLTVSPQQLFRMPCISDISMLIYYDTYGLLNWCSGTFWKLLQSIIYLLLKWVAFTALVAYLYKSPTLKEAH